jgi:ribonuclease G
MIKDILIDAKDDEYRIVVLEDSEPAEIHIEKENARSLVGNIYRGKVMRVMPGMKSAFVDIGLDKSAFLSVKDLIPWDYESMDDSLPGQEAYPDISGLLRQGNEISVQVIKDAQGEKGPRVTANISVPGRYAVLMPDCNFFGVSKKIEDREERKRLKKLALELKPENCGLILRTAAQDADDGQISEDIKSLLMILSDIKQLEEKGRVPRLLYSGSGSLGQVVREQLTPGINKFIVNDKEIYDKIISVLELAEPGLKAKVELYSKDYDMFEYYHVQSAIKEALSRKVWLKSGAYLVFDYTEALTVIDVNSGKFSGKSDKEETAFSINMEAAEMIARQIRLRNLSGIIIIDFIDMKQSEHRDMVVQALKNYVKNDRIRTVVLGMTRLGLVEMTRKKVKKPLSVLLQ